MNDNPSRPLPNELAHPQAIKRRKGSVFRAVVAVLVAFAMVAGGVLVTVAVLTGPKVRAEIAPATPAIVSSDDAAPA